MSATVAGPALLFCPGDRPERFAKAAAAADTVVLDLEDAVAPARKTAAREAVATALAGWKVGTVIVRVNAAGTPWHAEDLAALAAHPDHVVMLPKAEDPESVGGLAPHPVIALCETARGVLNAPAIARASPCAGVMWGGEDLAADLGARPGRRPHSGRGPILEAARTRTLYAARAARVVPIDTVLVDLTDPVTLRAETLEAVDAGYLAKACIHPTQVAVVRDAFRPGSEELDRARAVLAAAADHEGVFRFQGRMVDGPVLAHARDLLRRASPVSGTPPAAARPAG